MNPVRPDSQRIVVTGIGAVCVHGLTLASLIRGTLRGRRPWPIRTDWDYPDIGPQPFAGVSPFDAKSELPFLKPPVPLRYVQLALLAAAQAMSPFAGGTYREPTRFGSVVATEFGPNEAVERHLTSLMADGPLAVRPIVFSQTVMNSVLGALARRWVLQGPSSVLLGEQPFVYATDMLRNGEADAVLCGGVEEIRGVHVWAFRQAGVLASVDCSATTVTHGVINDGLVVGEGAAFIVLQTLKSALADDRHIYAELCGAGTARDRGTSHFFSRRSVEQTELAMRRSLDAAGLQPANISCVIGGSNSHPGTRSSELAAMESVFARSGLPEYLPLKDSVGETFGAGGPMSVALAAALLDTRPDDTFVVNSMHGGGTVNAIVLSGRGH